MTECHDWKHLAEAARDEEDPEKLLDLIQQLTRALDAQIKGLYPQSSEAAG
jgi:predicted component of type VI protein secretion system